MSTPTNNPTLDPAVTVNEILLKYPSAVSVFNDLGIDACCGGDASLEEAARRDGANLARLLAALDTIAALDVRSTS